MPHKDRIRLWVEDLRTTDAPQGTGRLRTPDGDCCLMRACLVYQRETGKGEVTNDESWGGGFEDGGGNCSNTALPPDVQLWYGLSFANPEILHDDVLITCQNANDKLRLTFAQIAGLLERTFLAGD